MSIWEEDFSRVKEAIDQLKAEGVTDFRAYCAAHPDFVERSISMVKIADVNDATLEMFAQPFLASGKYTSFKEFAEVKSRHMNFFGRDNGSTVATNTDAQSGAITGYTIDPDGPGPAAPFTFSNPDFNLRALRGTGVLRWEYRPGSTLYFVWTQERDGSDQFGDFNFGRDRSLLFRDRPTNIFQIKGTYWIGR